MTANVDTSWGKDAPIIGIVGLAHAGSHFAHLILPPLFPFIVADIELSYVELGLAMSIFFLVSGLLQVAAGFVVDRLGAERILIAGLTFLGLGALAGASADGFYGMVVATILLGIGNSVFHPADYALLGYHVAPARLGRAYSVHTIGGSLGWAVAPPLMTFLAVAFDWRLALSAAAVICFSITFATLLMHRRLRIPDLNLQSRSFEFGFLRERAVLMCFLFFTLQAFVIMAFQNFSPVALNLLFAIDTTTAALMLSAFLIGSSVGTLAGGIAADRQWNLELSIVLGYGLAAICLYLVGAIAMPVFWMVVLLTMAGGFKGFTTPSRDMLVRAVAGPGRAGRVFGVVYAGLDLGSTIAPYLTALLFDAGLVGWYFPMLAAMSLLTISTVIGARQSSLKGALP